MRDPKERLLDILDAIAAIERHRCRVRQLFENEPDFHVYSVNYDLKELLGRSDSPG